MKIEITNEQLLETIKPVTKASVDDYTKAIKSCVYAAATAYAFVFAAGLYLRDFVKAPRKYLQAFGEVAKRQQLEAVAAPVKPIPVKPAPANPAPVKQLRSRKRSSRNASKTTPAVSVV